MNCCPALASSLIHNVNYLHTYITQCMSQRNVELFEFEFKSSSVQAKHLLCNYHVQFFFGRFFAGWLFDGWRFWPVCSSPWTA